MIIFDNLEGILTFTGNWSVHLAAIIMMLIIHKHREDDPCEEYQKLLTRTIYACLISHVVIMVAKICKSIAYINKKTKVLQTLDIFCGLGAMSFIVTVWTHETDQDKDGCDESKMDSLRDMGPAHMDRVWLAIEYQLYFGFVLTTIFFLFVSVVKDTVTDTFNSYAGGYLGKQTERVFRNQHKTPLQDFICQAYVDLQSMQIAGSTFFLQLGNVTGLEMHAFMGYSADFKDNVKELTSDEETPLHISVILLVAHSIEVLCLFILIHSKNLSKRSQYMLTIMFVNVIPKVLELTALVLYFKWDIWRSKDMYLWITITFDFIITALGNLFAIVVICMEYGYEKKDKLKTQTEEIKQEASKVEQELQDLSNQGEEIRDSIGNAAKEQRNQNMVVEDIPANGTAVTAHVPNGDQSSDQIYNRAGVSSGVSDGFN